MRRGDAALGGSRRCDARGDGHTGGADRRRRETTANRCPCRRVTQTFPMVGWRALWCRKIFDLCSAFQALNKFLNFWLETLEGPLQRPGG
jgi:hypothetical protein